MLARKVVKSERLGLNRRGEAGAHSVCGDHAGDYCLSDGLWYCAVLLAWEPVTRPCTFFGGTALVSGMTLKQLGTVQGGRGSGWGNDGHHSRRDRSRWHQFSSGHQ